MKLTISAKCDDRFSAQLFDQQGNLKGEDYSGYVPKWFPNLWGDYIELEIDTDTGKILNWTPPTKEELDNYFPEKFEDKE